MGVKRYLEFVDERCTYRRVGEMGALGRGAGDRDGVGGYCLKLEISMFILLAC